MFTPKNRIVDVGRNSGNPFTLLVFPYHKSPTANTMITNPIVPAILNMSLVSARIRARYSIINPSNGPTTNTPITAATGHGQPC